MRKVIFGKVYDTNSAHLVGCWDNGEDDEEYILTKLFRKRTGEYFIYTIDAANAQTITPIGYESAKLRASKHLDKSAYEAEFCGNAGDDQDEQVVASYRISTKARAAIQREASRAGVSLGEVVERLAATLGE